jgi:hypothetical protein
MPEAVKISELPVMSTVQAGDIIPVVDAQLTQTGRATAAQIAAIGGGPPGDNTVSTAKIQGGAVTAAKVGFTAPDKLISRTAAGAGAGIEIACTPYARGLLEISNAAAARAYLDGLQSSNNPTFTGTVTVNGELSVSGNATMTGGQVRAIAGTASAPGYSFASDTNTGIASTAADTLNFVTGGVERLRISSTGAMSSPITAGGALYGEFKIRAWAQYNFPGGGIVGSGNISSIAFNSTGIADINFTQQMPDASYGMFATGVSQAGNVSTMWSYLDVAGSTPQMGFQIEFVGTSGNYVTPTAFSVVVIR